MLEELEYNIDYDRNSTKELLEVLASKGYSMRPESAYLAWRDFSNKVCASWLLPYSEIVDEFINWLY